MTYSGQSPIKGTGTAVAATIDGWIASMGRQLAPTFAPDKTYQAPPPIGTTIIELCAQVGVNSDLVTAQIVKESAGWQSAIVRSKNNPSGLGAINTAPMAGAITFDTPAAGIKATIAHLLSYVDGTANPWKSFDPRAAAIPSANLGAVHVLSDLDGRWAVPGNGYGAGIATLANELVATEGTATVTTTQPAPIWYPKAIRHSSPWSDDADVDSANIRVWPDNVTIAVQHHTDGSEQSVINTFTLESSTRHVSAHLMFARNGNIHQFVSFDRIAWQAGDWVTNVHSIGLEHEQSKTARSRSGWQPWTDVQLQNSAEAQAWLRAIMPSYDMEPHDKFTSTSCPGNLPISKIEKMMGDETMARRATVTEWTDQATGCKLIGGMLARWQQLFAKLGPEIYLVVGHPVTNETAIVDEMGQPTGEKEQKFEHQTWRWKSGQSPERFDVLVTVSNPFVAASS